ncbi:MAG: hypothetical protein KGH71_05645 [Candidatus Micrarchaeota archaeon]|nr:hypothetical protein [Candidatus Micrarchaeota archaeon]
MKKGNMKHRITVTVSDNELRALEDSLLVWNLCKKHNSIIFDHTKNRTLTEQEIFKMQDECESCKKCNRRIHRKAWAIACRLFVVWDKKKG